jgi:exosome complex component RRP42
MAAVSTSTALSPAELSYLHTSLSLTPPLRPDLRSPSEFRPLRAETDLLATCNGSAHVSLTDGSEALVGIKAEVHRTRGNHVTKRLEEEWIEKMRLDDESQMTDPGLGGASQRRGKGSPDWISLNVDISTLRDDDALLNFLSEMLREPLLTASNRPNTCLVDALVINNNWHWHLHIDILLLSPFSAAGTSYPLPLLSLATHLALRSTRLPKLKSQGEEDPLVDDDWESSIYLFSPRSKGKRKGQHDPSTTSQPAEPMRLPPITLLVMTAGPNIIFDPSHSELAVADAVLAISVGLSVSDKSSTTSTSTTPTILAIRTIETPARNTMKGVPASTSAELAPGEAIPGVWRPRIGGLKRDLLKRLVSLVVGGGVADGGVAREVFDGLEVFLSLS